MEYKDFLEVLMNLESDKQILDFIKDSLYEKKIYLTQEDIIKSLAFVSALNRKEANRTNKFLEMMEDIYIN